MTPDLEKNAAASAVSMEDGIPSSPSSASTSASDSEKETRPARSRSRGSDRHSTSSRHLQDPDAFGALEHALTADVETEAEREAREPITYTKSGASMSSIASRPPDFEVYFSQDDPDNPKNWSMFRRCYAIFVVSFASWLVVLYSTSYTGSTPGLMKEFGASETVTTLGVTTYLLGLAVGSLVLAPMSELYGRRPVYLVCMCIWAILIIPCGVAHSLTTIIVVRFFGALFGAVMISNSPGTVVDVCKPEYLSLGLSVFSLAPFNGPVLGPLIGGFVFEYKGWRWTNWIVLIIAGAAVGMLFSLKETYPPAILKQKAARLRKENDDPRWWCQYDQKVPALQLAKVNLSRPFILSATEPILWCINIWMSIVYGILYLCFIAYPVVFSQHRGWGPGVSGLAFMGIGIGILLCTLCEPLVRRFINSQPRDPVTGKVQPEAAALVMGIGTILAAVGQLGFSWTCLPATIHWAAPMAFGIPFGAGNTLCFIYGNNYLAGAYGIYAASALAGSAVLRSIFGGVLPLAGPKMYSTLSPQWAGTLLGLLEVMLIPIPFIFWRYGAKIRSNSKMIRLLREEEDMMEEKRLKNQARRERRARRGTERQQEDEYDAEIDEEGTRQSEEMRENLPRHVEEQKGHSEVRSEK
ncbi:MFS-type efflux pump MFS2 [Cladobotryum mycophilum]|uniref:MFS-type efflux pump MFS2 n=1 Tax=Cladobotryum mycophilum TaxID=491253 RepID=A0ABR0SUY1_9HYPO